MKTISTMRTRTTLTTAVFLAVSAVFLGTLTFGSAHAQQGPASGTLVTQENYCRAENSRMFAAGVKRAGGVNRFDHFRSVTPLDQQTAVRMNKDVLYSSAIVDTSKGATLTIPEMPDGRYFSVLLLDNDHYTPGTIYTPGTHTLPQDTKYLGLILRIHLLRPDDPADVALDAPEGWNFLMRVYRLGESVLHGSYKLPDAVPAKQ